MCMLPIIGLSKTVLMKSTNMTLNLFDKYVRIWAQVYALYFT